MVKKRSPIAVVLLSIVTLGIYALYWFVVTKDEMNGLGAKVPTAILIIIPIVNIYWLYKYAEAFATVVKKDNNTILWFVLVWFIAIIAMPLMQIELNKLAQ